MREMRRLLTVLVVLVGTGFVAALDVETTARKLENELMTPCCMTNTLAEHYSGPASAMKAEIREMLAAGKTEQEILDFYVAKHGNLILAVPPAEGFNLTVYLVPMGMLALGAVALVLVAKRWRAREVEVDPADEAPLDPAYAERVKRELRDLD
ncbi:MAG: cytochrome c-type biogenesis protein [Acidobacteriota bacterium]|nr:cytochrome c-type biogenesis protein [Acidobacteriota bacterium]